MILTQITNLISPHFSIIGKRILFILLIAVASHILVLLVRKISKLYFNRIRDKSSPKILSITSILTSTVVFIIYFLAIGYSLKEMGISLTAYIASASVIGLAVGFGSQGIVQDFVTGITLIVSNQIDIGDMVEINGQTGIVSSIGMRFVVFKNAFGAEVFIPNRNINVVINYPQKYINCYVDIILPESLEDKKNARETIMKMLNEVSDRYSNILIITKPKTETLKSKMHNEVFRIIFHIWPGRGTPIETTFKQELFAAMKAIDPTFEDWKISVNYEVKKATIKS